MSASQTAPLRLDDELTPDEAAGLLVEHLDVVRRVVEMACGRGLAHEADDCFAWVVVRLVEKDYVRLTAYRDAAPFHIYLRTVVIHLVRDYRISRWGRWARSKVAEDLGLSAMRLERLIWRDGHSVDHAVSIVAQLTGEEPAMLHALAAKIPARAPRRFVPEQVALGLQGTADAEGRLRERDQNALEAQLKFHLREILRDLDPSQRELLRRHFKDGEAIAVIAREQGEAGARYYSRLRRCLANIRAELLSRGIGEEVLEHLRWTHLEMTLTSLLEDTQTAV